MAMPIRVKTIWFKKDGERSAEEIASRRRHHHLARCRQGRRQPRPRKLRHHHTGARLQADCRIPRLSGALLRPHGLCHAIAGAAHRGPAGGLQPAGRSDGREHHQRRRQADANRNFKAEFIDFLNRRFADYAEFEFPDDDKASFPALRFLGLQIRDEMGDNDKTWIMDQIMDIEMPEMMGTVRKSFKGLLSDAPVKRGFGSPDMLPPE